MKAELSKFVTAAKAIVYSEKQAEQFMEMIDTQQGAVDAVMAVMGVIEQKRPVPPELSSLLAVNVYLMMVDVAMAATGEKPDKATMKQTINTILSGVKGAGGQPAPAEPEAPQQPQGLIGAAA